MGAVCPYCGTHQAFVVTITADGQGAEKASEVLGRKLACGHTIGGQHYTEFITQSTDIDLAAAKKIFDIQEAARAQKSGLWATLTKQGV